MGLHTGEAQERDRNYFGAAVNRAARLMATAHGGQIVCSHATADVIRDVHVDGVELVDLGDHRLRDLSRPERVFELRSVDAVASFPPLRSVDAFPGNLPVQLTSFIGRDDELAAVAQALEDSRLVTLTGVGGVGKTRLALQVAAEVLPRFGDGVWLCELAATNEPEMLAQVVVAAIGVQSRAGRSLTESVCDYLSGKRALIVLDNCEHLLEGASAIAESILRTSPDVRVLATSREPLGVAGERLLGVPSLRVSSEPGPNAIAACEAVQLFMDRAQATRPGLRLDTANANQIAEICRRLDAIPLAIELAAARMTSMSPSEIATRLDERFRLLTGGRRRGVERHQTLQAAVEWSYSMLGERERKIFDRLGVFAGSFDADAAAAVTAAEEFTTWDVRDALDDLAVKSMIALDDVPEDTTRFRLLETLRQYALERLDDAVGADECRRRHAAHYATVAEAAGPGLLGPDEVQWARRFEADLDNLRSAVGWALDAEAAADVHLGLRIIAALGCQGFFRPSAGVGGWAELAVASVEGASPGLRAGVLACAAWESFLGGSSELGRARATEALSDGVFADTPSPAWAHAALASGELMAGEYLAAAQTIASGHDALDDIQAPDAAHFQLDVTRAVIYIYAGENDDARAFADALLRRARTLATPSFLIQAIRWHAHTRTLEEIADTIDKLEECVAYSRAVATPDGTDVLQALGLLGRLRANVGERIPAIEALRQAIARAYDIGQLFTMVSLILNYCVSAAADLGAPEFAGTLGGFLTVGPLSEDVTVAPSLLSERQAALHDVRAQLGVDRYEAGIARGAAMSFDEAVEYTLGELDRLHADCQ
jgi:predicted ATPase